MRDPEPLRDTLDRVLAAIGAPRLDVWMALQERWAEIAGPPWDTHARPLALTGGVLVVEANSPGAVSLLRYGVAGLVERLGAALPGVVGEVTVRPPPRPGRGAR